VLRAVTAGSAVTALCAVTTAPVTADGAPLAAQPTVVLVHGAFADGSSWNGVIERLEHRGYTVMAPANPLRGLYNDSAYIASVLKTVKGPIVLVGHSYGGAVISSAAAGNPQVKSLVYINALMPDVGESGMSLSARFPSALATATTSVPYRTTGGSGTDLYLKRDRVHPVFANCLSAEQANLLAVTQRPAATAAFSETAKAAAWKEIPSWALVGRQDRTISPQQERFEAQRAHSHTKEIDSCHVSLIAHPDAVADLIVQGATAAAGGSAPKLANTGTGLPKGHTLALGALAAALLTAGGAVLLRLGRRPQPARR
jgi:pimeloyl-ACP methyl ester carboxylesterase